MTAIKNLVAEIVDYAGLFPPAKLPLEDVVRNYEHYLGSEFSWMLARLITPAGRLVELNQQPPFLNSAHHWRISALVPSVAADDQAFATAMQAIDDFNAQHEQTGRAIVDTIEIKAPSSALIEQTAASVPESINAFLEIPHDQDPDALIAAIARAPNNIFVKIRTGGVTTDLIPPAEQVARFIACCAKHRVGFKATAGLHHPICGSYRLTYDEQPDFGDMFGYMNVFVAAAMAFAGQDENVLTQILSESDPDNFYFGEDKMTWNEVELNSDQIAQARKKAISFGSCSFTEPTEELILLKPIKNNV